MSKIKQQVNNTAQYSDLEQTAAKWFLKMQAPDVSEAEKTEFLQWLRADKLHQSEYFRLRKLWQALPQALDASPVTNKKRLLPWHWAASFAASICVFVTLLLWQFDPAPEYHVHQTKVGETKEVTLSDGSLVTLNTNTKIKVHFDSMRRDIQLLQGEAYFDVAKAAERPFVVTYKQMTFEALGTAFLVRAHNTVQLLVTEHSVKATNHQGVSTIVEEHDAILVDQHWQTSQLKHTAHFLAWKHNQLIFEQKPLSSVLQEIDRYLPGNVQLLNADLADELVSGVFELNQPEAILQTIADTLGLTLHKTSAHDFFLS